MIPPGEGNAPEELEGDTRLDAQIAEGFGDLSNIDVIRSAGVK